MIFCIDQVISVIVHQLYEHTILLFLSIFHDLKKWIVLAFTFERLVRRLSSSLEVLHKSNAWDKTFFTIC
jgi:hypothetical protein